MNTTLIIVALVWLICWGIALGYIFAEHTAITFEDMFKVIVVGMFAPVCAFISIGLTVAQWYEDNKDRTLITLRKPERKVLNSEPERWK